MNYSPIELTRQEPLFRSHRLNAIAKSIFIRWYLLIV